MHHDEEDRDQDGRDRPSEGRFPDPAFVDELRGIYREHFRAVQESEAQRPRRRPALRVPLRARPALVVALTLLFGGVAVAAVTLGIKESAPLSGRLPPQADAARWGFGFTEAGGRYRIVFAPTFAAGDAGWTSFLYLGRYGRQGRIGGGEGYPTKGMPLSRTAGTYVATGHDAGKLLHYVLTGPSVAAVNVGSQTILTRSGHALPADDRIAVFATSERGPSLPRRPSQPPGAGLTSPRAVRPLSVVPLERGGRPIGGEGSSAQAPRLPTLALHHAPGSVAAAAGACALSRHGLPALTPLQAEVALTLRPVTNAVGELMLSCLQATYTLHGSQLRAAILLNARHPGASPPGPIPGARAVKGHPGTVNVLLGPTVGNITARRAGNAWLAVAGGSGLTQRLEALAALRVAKIAGQRSRRS